MTKNHTIAREYHRINFKLITKSNQQNTKMDKKMKLNETKWFHVDFTNKTLKEITININKQYVLYTNKACMRIFRLYSFSTPLNYKVNFVKV